MSDRFYLITDAADGSETCIEARSAAEARSIHTATRYTVRVARIHDMLRAIERGTPIVTRMHQPAQTSLPLVAKAEENQL